MIYFLRHLKTLNNELGFISGQADSPILGENITISDNKIIEYIDKVYSSPAQRCLDTLNNISDLTITPIVDKRLLERNMGDFESCSRDYLYNKYPTFFKKVDGQIFFRFELTPPNGESYSEFRGRIYSFCTEIEQLNGERNILICSHNQAIKMMYFTLLGVQPTEKNWNKITFPNGKIISVC